MAPGVSTPYFPGTLKFGRACCTASSREGGDFSAQPASARPTSARSGRRARIRSVQLEDQVVQVRADADDHLADDVHRVQVVGVDRGVAGRAGGEEQLPVALG